MNLLIISGAGISVGSGLPTYRGVEGKYTKISKEVGMPIEQLLSPKTFSANPEVVWKYWLQFALELKKAKPSQAHTAIKVLSEQADDFLEVTQNVDGLSRVAGLADHHLIELHGTYRKHYCTHCNARHELGLSELMSLPPRCYRCGQPDGAVIRPDVVMFDELIDEKKFTKAQNFADKADLVIISGTTMMFPYLMNLAYRACLNDAVILYVDPAASTDNILFSMIPKEANLEGRMFFIKQSADEALPVIAEDLDTTYSDFRSMVTR